MPNSIRTNREQWEASLRGATFPCRSARRRWTVWCGDANTYPDTEMLLEALRGHRRDPVIGKPVAQILRRGGGSSHGEPNVPSTCEESRATYLRRADDVTSDRRHSLVRRGCSALRCSGTTRCRPATARRVRVLVVHHPVHHLHFVLSVKIDVARLPFAVHLACVVRVVRSGCGTSRRAAVVLVRLLRYLTFAARGDRFDGCSGVSEFRGSGPEHERWWRLSEFRAVVIVGV